MNIYDLNDRQTTILSLLYYSNYPATGQKLGSLIDVSSRTIRSDVRTINEIFGRQIIEATHQGYELSDKNTIKNLINDGINRKNHRGDIILTRLLSLKEPIDIDELSDAMYISKTTLLNDLNSIILDKGLKIVKANKTVILQGLECQKRMLISQIIYRSTNKTYVCLSEVQDNFSDVDVFQVNRILHEVLDKNKVYIDNSYLINVVLNLSVAISRIIRDFPSDCQTAYNKNSISYVVAADFAKNYELPENLKFSRNDIQYFSSIFLGKIKPHQEVNDQIRTKVRKILKEVFKLYGIKADFKDREDIFVSHIEMLIERYRSGNLVQNSMEKIIKYRSPHYYDVAIQVAYRLKKEFDLTLNDSEISYLAIHIGAAIESGDHKKLKCVLLGNGYFDSINTIVKNVERDFSNQLTISKTIYSRDELEGIGDFDMLITTDPVYIFQCNYARITYLYSEDDYIKILNTIAKTLERKKNEKIQKMLKTLFSKDLFFNNTQLNNMDEILSFLNEELLKKGIVNEDFYASVLEREHISSTVIDGVFAFPHSLNLNENETRCVVLINEKGFQWKSSRIPFIILFCINRKDMDIFMELYNNLSKILLYEDNHNTIFDLHNYEEFIDFISYKLRNLL